MFGYQGRFLQVDLSTGKTKDIELEKGDLKNFIGGSSLAAKLIYGYVKKNMDPLGAENPLVFATGPFTGTTIPMVSRSAVCGISPLTGIWGESTTGGIFPFHLKASGFDGILIIGRADKPVYLYVNNGKAEIRDASHLWGIDTYQTQDKLKEELGNTQIGIACIGLAGENIVKYASIINDHGRASGRCGMGALMGSKNLKAVVSYGTIKAELANKDKISQLTKTTKEAITSNFVTPMFRESGTMLHIDIGLVLGDVPVRYFTRNIFPAENINPAALNTTYKVKSHACFGCPIACGRNVSGFKEISRVDGPEYETTCAFGSLCMNYDLDSIIQANHLCNVYGIDTISTGVCIAYAMYLYEKGILSKDSAGMEINWGDGAAIVKLVEMIAKRVGIGRLLGEGVRAISKELGSDPGEAAHVKGLEIPMHDARAFTGMAISYATGPRGACHLKGDYYLVDFAGLTVPELDIIPGDRFQSAGKAVSAAKFQNLKDLYDSLLLCKFCPLPISTISEIFTHITGWDCTPSDINIAGERSVNIKRAISNKLGVTRYDDVLPKICREALKEGGSDGKSPDMDIMLKEYYAYREWDWNTGKPTLKKLVELGLDDVARDLWSS